MFKNILRGICTHKLLELISKFSQLQDPRSTCESNFFFYILTMSNWKVKSIILFIIAWKEWILKSTSFKRHVILVFQNYKTLLKDIIHLNEHRDISCSWIRRFNVVRGRYLPKLSKASLQSLSKFQLALLQKFTSWLLSSCGDIVQRN